MVGDFNTRFSFSVPGRIGEYVWDSNYGVPEGLLNVLHEQDLWVPATFPGIHTGPHETWAAPGQSACARLDYVSVPASWVAEPGSARVRHDVDPGHRSVDHFAVSVAIWVRPLSRDKSMHRGRQYDRKAMSTEEGRAKLCDICEAIPLQPWELDADTHYHNVQEFIVSRLAEAFPPGRRKRVESVISDATWVIKDHRLWLRRQTAAQRRRVKQQELLASFRAWQKHRDITVSRCVVMAWTCAEACQAASFVQQLRRSRMELRQAIRKDRRDFVERLARETAESSAKEVLCRMRPLLRCAGRKRGGNRALPATQLEDGTLAVDEVQALDRWVHHFASIEGGERVSPAVLVGDRQARLKCAREPVEIHLGEVPTRICLERACHNVACGKAMGPDAVPGELMRHASRSISKPMYQLMLKLALRGDEPTIFKGGIVYAAWKGRGAQAVCANHRGLLVSSVVGKTIHAAIRRKLIPVLGNMASPLQVGGLPRFPVAYAAHAARLFQSAFRQSNFFILFLDLKEAFYRLARPLLTSEQPSDESFARLFAALQLPQPVFAAFRHAVCSEPALKTSGATEWVQMVISEMLQQTWFSLPGQGDVVRTCLGSRPGDGLADILFSLVFADVLVRGAVQETATASAQPDIGFLDVSWMDDLAILGPCSTAKEVPEVLATTAGILIDTCLSRGMFPNLDRNKTEVIVGLRVKGAHAVRKALLSDTEPRLLTTSRCWPEQRIHVVASYKHLGGVLHHQGRLEAEARTRSTLPGLHSTSTNALFSASTMSASRTKWSSFSLLFCRFFSMVVARGRGVNWSSMRGPDSTVPTSAWAVFFCAGTLTGMSVD